MSITDNLRAYWSFDDAIGSTVLDQTMHGNNGTWQGTLGSQWVSGKINRCGSFNGTDNYVRTPSIGWVNGENTSIAGWVNFDDADTIARTDKYHELFGASFTFIIRYRSGPTLGANNFLWLQGTTRTGGTNNISVLYNFPSFQSGWHHIAATYDGVTIRLYFDSVQVASQSIADAGIASLRDFVIGINSDVNAGTWWDGLLDEVSFWSRAISDNEIKFLYNSGSGRSYAQILDQVNFPPGSQLLMSAKYF